MSTPTDAVMEMGIEKIEEQRAELIHLRMENERLRNAIGEAYHEGFEDGYDAGLDDAEGELS